MGDKKRVLFVDDEPDVLSGIKRMLRSMRTQFDMEFATGGEEALELMSETSCDIVVSDMRMPGMDGAELLTKIKQMHPNTIRLMLTGHADDEAILRTVGVVHQFMAKPCESEALKLLLTTVSALHDRLSDSRLKSIISSTDSLPSLPENYARLQQVIADPDSALSDIGAIIEEDLGMSAKILQLVNSAFFGLYRHIDSPSHAVSLLGLDTVKSLVLGVQVFSELRTESRVLSMDEMFSHSMAVGAIANKIAQTVDADKMVADDCLIAGILHGVGQLLLLANIPEEYEQVLGAVGPENSLYEVEREMLHADHGAVGAYLIGLWGLPGQVVEAICFHHRLQEYPQDGFSPALAVHIANVLHFELKPDMCIGACPALDEQAVSKAGLDSKVDEFRTIATEVVG
jgi:HD-like signal output (HDOD) protein